MHWGWSCCCPVPRQAGTTHRTSLSPSVVLGRQELGEPGAPLLLLHPLATRSQQWHEWLCLWFIQWWITNRPCCARGFPRGVYFWNKTLPPGMHLCSPLNFPAMNCCSFRAAEFRVLKVRRHSLCPAQRGCKEKNYLRAWRHIRHEETKFLDVKDD